MSTSIIITGGGTGGHVFPALAIAEECRSRGLTPLYVGSDRGLEAKLAPAKGIRFVSVRSGAVKNQSFLKILKSLVNLLSGLIWSIGLLRREKPKAVVGVGGYVSVPVCFAAFLMRIPVFLQEQNVSVGIANRFLGKISEKVFLGFAQATAYFKPSKCEVTGNPIRREFSEKVAPYNPSGKIILIMGGSQGAQAINDVILRRLSALDPSLHIIHQTGVRDLERVKQGYKDLFKGKFEILPFIEDMVSAYSKATLVISRSGALTVSELIEVGRPAIFVPYPRQGQNDQTANAHFLEVAGAARVVEQGEAFEERFWSTFQECFQPVKLQAFHTALTGLRTSNATATIGSLIQAELS